MRGLALAVLAIALPAGAAGAAGGTGAPPTIAGCPVFPASSVWNQPVNTLPVATDSAALIRSIGLDAPVHADFGSGLYDGQRIGIPYVVVSGSDDPEGEADVRVRRRVRHGPLPDPGERADRGRPAARTAATATR